MGTRLLAHEIKPKKKASFPCRLRQQQQVHVVHKGGRVMRRRLEVRYALTNSKTILPRNLRAAPPLHRRNKSIFSCSFDKVTICGRYENNQFHPRRRNHGQIIPFFLAFASCSPNESPLSLGVRHSADKSTSDELRKQSQCFRC